MDSPFFWPLLVVSIICTALCWYRILTRSDLFFFKIAGLVISAIPFFGPVFFLFFDMPRRLPEDAQVTWSARSGATTYSERFDRLYQGNRQYLDALYREQNDKHRS